MGNDLAMLGCQTAGSPTYSNLSFSVFFVLSVDNNPRKITCPQKTRKARKKTTGYFG
jgi:hypothetical protein